MEKTYTVKEIAQKLHLTDRTIRNYLASGQLKGTRVGGQWRFSQTDIMNLFQTSEFRKKVKDKANSNAKDFIDKKLDMEGPVTVCAIINYENKDQDYMDKLECEAGKIALNYKGNVKFTAVSEKGMGRCTVIGTIECVSRVLEVFKKLEN